MSQKSVIWAAVFALAMTFINFGIGYYHKTQLVNDRVIIKEVIMPDGSRQMKALNFNCIEQPTAAVCSDIRGSKY